MPTVIDLIDYIIALKQEVAKRDQIIEQLNKAKK
jgi:hypothetical protein